MVSGTPTRLEIHRLKHRMTGGATGSLSVRELTPEERVLLDEETFWMMTRYFWDFQSARGVVYASWGVSATS